MNTFVEYLIKSGLSLSILYLFYWIVMRHGTHFLLNRLVLLFSLLVSLLLPVISLNILATPKFQATLPDFTVSLNEFVVNATTPVVQNSQVTINWWKILSIIYFAGAAIIFARLVYQGIYLHVMSKLSKTIRRGNFTVVLMNADITPFAYFRKIFIPDSKAYDCAIESIIAHERSHQQQYHFFDLFVMELVTILQWFNPVVWFYERSLKEVHEYLADEAVLHQGQNKGIYQALLVNQAMGGPVFSLTNQFNQSLIKKRIVMMTKMKTPRFAQLKALLVVPLVSLLLLAFANPKMVKPMIQKGNELSNTNVQPSSIVIDKASNITGNKPSVTVKDTVKIDNNTNAIAEEDVPLQFVEQMPEFPGGQKAMMNFLSQNIKYPTEALKNNVTGRVILQFIIDHSGNVKKVKVLRGIGAGCDEEAVRVVKLFPTWKPGRDHGKEVSVYFTLPIVFSLKENKVDKQVKENEQVTLTKVDQMPEFPGGIDSMMRFLSVNIKYPKEAVDKNITGRVIVQFIIDRYGKVITPKVLRGIGSGCDEEAIRVVNAMPIWKPGKEKGKEVNVYFVLPIVFLIKK